MVTQSLSAWYTYCEVGFLESIVWCKEKVCGCVWFHSFCWEEWGFEGITMHDHCMAGPHKADSSKAGTTTSFLQLLCSSWCFGWCLMRVFCTPHGLLVPGDLNALALPLDSLDAEMSGYVKCTLETLKLIIASEKNRRYQQWGESEKAGAL